MTPSLDIVIVNWNTGRQLRACLDSIVRTSRLGYVLRRVIVVDNASSDGSCDSLEAEDLPLVAVRNLTNRGFAAACNQGARGSDADYLLFLNPDVVLFERSLERPLAFLETSAAGHAGICGIRLIDEAGTPCMSAARFPSAKSFLIDALGLSRSWPRRFPPTMLCPDENVGLLEVDQVIGAFFLIRRHLFVQLEGFDERFFVYFEELDLSLRARRLGHSSWVLTDVAARHLGGLSTGQVRAKRLFYSLRSRLVYASKHYSRAGRALVTVATVLELGPRLLRAALRASAREARETLVAYWWLAPALVASASRRDASGPTSPRSDAPGG
ncbi:MAG TPA: glycosyltransferase family 2 protein [Vicinamibacterales bacterium]|jgi:hypothetical protein